MATRKQTLTGYQQRIVSQLGNIQDEDFRDLLVEVIVVESRNRSAARFPISQIRDIIDGYARLEERADDHSKE